MRSDQPLRMSNGFASISVIGAQLGLTGRAIRYYEEIGLVESQRDRENRRRFDPRARARLEAIARFRRAGLSLEDIRVILDRHDGETGSPGPVDYAIARLSARLEALDAERRSVEACLDGLVSQTPRAVANGGVTLRAVPSETWPSAMRAR